LLSSIDQHQSKKGLAADYSHEKIELFAPKIKLCGQLDYFIFKIINYIAPLRASAMPCNARGLVVAHSRKLSATLGGSTSTRPRVRKIIFKTYNFVDISNAMIPTALGGLTTASPPIVAAILRQQLAYLYIVDYGRVDRGAPDKS
jgi:hypothetical protein